MIRIIVDKPSDGGNAWKCEHCYYAKIAGGSGFDVVICQYGIDIKGRTVTRCNQFSDKRVRAEIWTLPMASIQPALFLETNESGEYEWHSWQKWKKDN